MRSSGSRSQPTASLTRPARSPKDSSDCDRSRPWPESPSCSACPSPRPSSATLPTPPQRRSSRRRKDATRPRWNRAIASTQSVREDCESGTRDTGNLTAGREADGGTPSVTPRRRARRARGHGRERAYRRHRRSGRRCPSRGWQPAIRGRGLRTGRRRRLGVPDFGAMTATARTSTSPARTRCSLDSFSLPTRCAPMRAS